MKNFFKKINAVVEKRVLENGAQYTAFGLFGVFNYPIYYIIWLYFSRQPYSNLLLRIIATLLCFGLVVNKYWPKKLKPYLPIYWYISLAYCLPLFFAFMLIRNNFSLIWFANSILVFYFLILLVDFKSFVVLFLIGTGLGVLLAYILPHTPLKSDQSIDYVGIIVTYLVSFVIGGMFARNRDKIELAKLQTIKAAGATIAHEIRTPLIAIHLGVIGAKNYLPALVKAYIAAKEQNIKVEPIQTRHLQILSGVFDSIESQIKYANTIINMTLMNVKQDGASKNDMEVCSMNSCIEEAVQRYPFKKDELKKIEWSVKEDFLFKGDKTLMVHVLFNLMKNALYYIEAANKGKIQISYDSNENENILIFQDTAQGIPSNVLPKLFEKFYTTARHGTGLGLAFCKTTILSFGGTISCKSNYGEFTQFIMTFPKIKNTTNV